jgi:hypothetical protein
VNKGKRNKQKVIYEVCKEKGKMYFADYYKKEKGKGTKKNPFNRQQMIKALKNNKTVMMNVTIKIPLKCKKLKKKA